MRQRDNDYNLASDHYDDAIYFNYRSHNYDAACDYDDGCCADNYDDARTNHNDDCCADHYSRSDHNDGRPYNNDNRRSSDNDTGVDNFNDGRRRHHIRSHDFDDHRCW